MTPEKMIQELAVTLRDVIQETPESHLREDPEDAYVDLACRLVHKLSRTLTIVPVTNRFQAELSDAARRALIILTEWMAKDRGRHYITGTDTSGKISIHMRDANGTIGFFRGTSVQDAYAQAAQVLHLDEPAKENAL